MDLDGASVDEVLTRKIKVVARRAKPPMAAAMSGTQRTEADVAPHSVVRKSGHLQVFTHTEFIEILLFWADLTI